MVDRLNSAISTISMPNELLTVAQAANRLGVSVARVRVWLAEGRIQGQRVGRDWVISEASLSRPEPKPAGRKRGPKKESTDDQA